MTDNTCKNCRFWSTNNSPLNFCENKKFMNNFPPSDSLEYDVVVYMGDYESDAILMTGEDFGCIHFEEKS